MAPVLPHKVLLIDLENCPNQINQLQNDLAEFSQVVICYAQNNSKISLDWLMNLVIAVNDNKLKIIKMENGGKNAADFGICFFAGMLMQSFPTETHFVVVSNDADLDHAVRLLISQGRTAERVGKAKEEPKIAFDTSSDIINSAKEYCLHLVNHSSNRPATKTTLLNSIKNKLKDSPVAAEQVYDHLLKSALIKVDGNKVAYDSKKIQTLSNNP